MTKQEPRIKLPPAEQIGIVVRDMDRAIEYYSSTFGWGPFRVIESNPKGTIYRGKKCDCHLKLAFAWSGSIQIELIQILEGETPLTDHLKEKGEGLQHLRFRVDNLDSTLAELAKDGIRPIWYHRTDERAFAYINSDTIGGVMFELLEIKQPPVEKK